MNPSVLMIKMIDRLRDERAGWWLYAEAHKDDPAVLAGEPCVIACPYGLALRVEHYDGQRLRALPVPMKPGLHGVSHYNQADAERIAKARGAPYRVVLVRDVPALRLQELDERLRRLEGDDS